mgnify:CR=1 FL=1
MNIKKPIANLSKHEKNLSSRKPNKTTLTKSSKKVKSCKNKRK